MSRHEIPGKFHGKLQEMYKNARKTAARHKNLGNLITRARYANSREVSGSPPPPEALQPKKEEVADEGVEASEEVKSQPTLEDIDNAVHSHSATESTTASKQTHPFCLET